MSDEAIHSNFQYLFQKQTLTIQDFLDLRNDNSVAGQSALWQHPNYKLLHDVP